MSFHKFIYWLLYLQYLVLLSRFLRGELQPVVFNLSCSLNSLAKILCVYMLFHIEILKKIRSFV
ncbi:hypothetical protein PYN25_01070 [Staphylococcus epidermidis]|nr:hypothetical protein [Staphylococcus epidermidis]MDH9423231.1 hypothetical protein [Staphylococcus epidermidis]MDH9432445.1 hypothetical protein [Staphylococcus epidermidis]MDH9447796.1 hypothetical protein [Staphylococcus epidermidis]MDH9452546.1 hypothetical protein [Staphylococcus epidermidis]